MFPFAIVPLSVGCSHLFCCRLLLLVQFCVRLFAFDSLLRRFALFVFGSDVKDVFVGVAIDEPSGDKQMAHLQIVVVTPVSNPFRMDVVSMFHWFLCGCVGFMGPILLFLMPFTIICFGMLSFACVCFVLVSYMLLSHCCVKF